MHCFYVVALPLYSLGLLIFNMQREMPSNSLQGSKAKKRF